MFALALLIGAPLLVSLLGNSLFDLQAIIPNPDQARASAEYMAAPVDPAANLPHELNEPVAGQTAQNGQHAGGTSGAVSLTDPAGTSVEGSNPAGVSADPAAAAMASAAPAMDAGPAMALPEDESAGSYAPPGSEEYLIKHPRG